MNNNNQRKNQIVINIPVGMTIEEKNAAKQLVNATVVYAVNSLKTRHATPEQIVEEAKNIVEQVKENEQQFSNQPQNGGAKKPKRKSPAKKPKSKKSPAKKPKRKSPAKK